MVEIWTIVKNKRNHINKYIFVHTSKPNVGQYTTVGV